MTWMFTVPAVAQTDSQRSKDKDMLGKALDYFGGGKYHEAGILFTKLQEKYELNPRFKAYLAVCHFQEQEYEKATMVMDEVLPELTPFSPHELSFYYYAAAESHFQLEQYDTAMIFFQKTLPLCHNDEKGDILFRIGFCHLFLSEEDKAKEDFAEAVKMFRTYNRSDKTKKARAAQTEIMLKHLLVPHGTRRVNVTDKEAWNDKNKNADNKNSNIKSKHRKKVYLHRRG